MPIVHVNVWEGFGREKVKTVIQNITKVFVDLGVPEQAVEVIVHESQNRTGELAENQLQKSLEIYLQNKLTEVLLA